jgi:hypothetical protein
VRPRASVWVRFRVRDIVTVRPRARVRVDIGDIICVRPKARVTVRVRVRNIVRVRPKPRVKVMVVVRIRCNFV